MEGLSVLLAKEQEDILKNSISKMLLEAVTDIKKTTAFDRDFLKVTEAAKWAGVSLPTFYRWIDAGLPKADVPGGTFYSKTTITEWIRIHEE